MSSGFLFEGHGFQKHDDVKKYGKKFIKKLIIPFVLWGGVYAVIDIVGDVFIDKIPMVDACVTKLCEILTESPGGGLWYIYSLIWIVIVLIFIYDPQKDKSFLMLTTAFLLLYFLKAMWKTPAIEIGIIQWTRNVYTLIFSSDRTFLFHGIFYIIGMILAKKKRKLKKVSPFANSRFLRTAGPHFPDSPGHIKRTAWDIGRARGAPPC